ncbi:MAG: hypothetical protein IPK70_11470 [Flavobacteriales bacterium]|nr:hypothetical protein [Flavobacteriales bacterium]
MDRLCSLAVGVALEGRAYRWLHGTILNRHRHAHQCPLHPCDVYHGLRTKARMRLCQQWDRQPEGFVRRAQPLAPGPYRYFGWQAPPVPGGACGGLPYADGLSGHLGLKLRLRRTKALLEHLPVQLYIKVGVPAACGALGTRLVPPKLWSPVPPDHLAITSFISSDERFLNVVVRWV